MCAQSRAARVQVHVQVRRKVALAVFMLQQALELGNAFLQA